MRCAKPASTTVIVVLNEGEEERRAAAGCLDSLSRYLRRVRAVELSHERPLSSHFQSADGQQALYDALMADLRAEVRRGSSANSRTPGGGEHGSGWLTTP